MSIEYLGFKNKIDSLHLAITVVDNEIAGYNEELTLLSNNRNLSSDATDLSLEKVKSLTSYYRTRVTQIRNKLQMLQLQKLKISETIRDYGNEMLKLKDNKEEERGEITLKLDAPGATNLVLSFTYTIKNAGWFPLYDVRATDIDSPVSFRYKANVYQQSGTDWDNVNIVLSTGDPTTNNEKPDLDSKWLRFVSRDYKANKAVGNSSVKYNPAVGTVSGYVYDDSGLPLPGVNVILKGTNSGTQTDFDGRYSINASGAREMIFSYVGFDTQKIPVSSSKVNVTLEPGASLSEVMITGGSTFSQKNKNTGKPKESFVQTLSGMVPGLNISSTNGQPGANGNVRIRGISSINGDTEPLFIINGVPRSKQL